jgi:hypothetical protein
VATPSHIFSSYDGHNTSECCVNHRAIICLSESVTSYVTTATRAEVSGVYVKKKTDPPRITLSRTGSSVAITSIPPYPVAAYYFQRKTRKTHQVDYKAGRLRRSNAKQIQRNVAFQSNFTPRAHFDVLVRTINCKRATMLRGISNKFF